MEGMDQGDSADRGRPQPSGASVRLRPPPHSTPSPASGATDEVCPYQGLATFDAAQTALFFGRTRAIRGIIERLAPRLTGQGTVLLVSGASGVGKSSLLRAGLLPALANGMLPIAGSRHWPRLLMTPTSRPLRRLAASWTEAFGGDAQRVHERLRDDPRQALPGDAAPGCPLVLVVDQFEDAFTLVADERERGAFVTALHALAAGSARAAVIIGVRADYWDRCAAYPQFAEAIQNGQVIVEPMTEADLRLAIIGPAAAVGLEIEHGLVDVILDDLRAGRSLDVQYGAGALPLLSQALRNIWERRDNGLLTVRGYEESGQVRDSVRRTAGEVFGQLSAVDRKIVLKVFRRMTLITAGGRIVRRSATLPEIYAAAAAESAKQRADVDALLSAFAGRRLITLHEDVVEIAHDALLTAWPTLRLWLEPDLTAQALYDQLIDDAARWAKHHRDPAFLYQGARLLSVQDTLPRWARDPGSFPPPGPVVDGFVAASTREARRVSRRRRLVMACLAALTVIALIAAVIAINRATEADRQRNLTLSRELAAQSEVAGDPVISALLAVAAWRIAPTAEARHRLLVAVASPDRAVLTGHGADITALAFSPDGKIIASGSTDGTARLWDAASHRQLGAPILPPPAQGSCVNLPVRVALSPDGRLVASTCMATVWFWDVATHRRVGRPLHTRNAVSAIAFAPDGRTFATGDDQGDIRLWDAAAGRPPADIPASTATRAGRGHTIYSITGVVFSADGKRLVTGSADGTARLWDAATSDQVGAVFAGHTKGINDIALSPDGATLATAGGDGTVRLWSMATHRQVGRPLTASGGKAPFEGVAFSPDGKRLVTAGSDGRARIWDTAGHQQLGNALGGNLVPLKRVAFSPDGRLLGVAGDDGAVRLLDPEIYRQVGSAMPGRSAVALSPDGMTLAVEGPGKNDPAILLRDVAGQRPVGRPLRAAGGPGSGGPGGGAPGGGGHIVFDYYGRTLTAVGPDDMRTWETASGRRLSSFGYPGAHSGVAELSSDGSFLALNRDDSVLFWDVVHRREIGSRISAPGYTDVIGAMALNPDGTMLATVGLDGSVRLFDVAAGRQIGAPLPVPTNGLFVALAFSPDGRFLAIPADNGTVRLWDVAKHEPVSAALSGHTGIIRALAFSPDGKILATGSEDATVRLWDLATYREIGPPLTGHAAAVTGVAYGRDGTTLATVSDDGTARLWDVGLPDDPVAAACAIAARSLTRAEWARYVPQERFRQICL